MRNDYGRLPRTTAAPNPIHGMPSHCSPALADRSPARSRSVRSPHASCISRGNRSRRRSTTRSRARSENPKVQAEGNERSVSQKQTLAVGQNPKPVAFQKSWSPDACESSRSYKRLIIRIGAHYHKGRCLQITNKQPEGALVVLDPLDRRHVCRGNKIRLAALLCLWSRSRSVRGRELAGLFENTEQDNRL